MKTLLRAGLFSGICTLLIACAQSITPTAWPVPAITATAAATTTPLPSQPPTLTITLTDRPEHIPPTLIPTIDPTLVPGLLSQAFSIKTWPGIYGYLRQITGWDYGFGGGYWQGSCAGYDWLDASHLLLYPAAGEVNGPEGSWTGVNVVPQSVVINLESGHVWLPPNVPSASPQSCNRVYWSSELGILIVPEFHNDISSVSTYTYDGQKLSSYTGSIVDVSPYGTKILLEDNTLIDLRTNRRIPLDWSLEDYREEMLSDVFWTSDETRIYRCCYFYADLTTGTSYRFEQSEFQDTNGKPLDRRLLWFYRGGWIQNDTYFLVTWSWVDDGDIRYLPMFDPAKKIFLDVRKKAGIPGDWSCVRNTVSPDGRYIWMSGWGENGEGSYLVDLSTFKSQYYPNQSTLDVDWSPNSKFALLYNSTLTDLTDQYSMLSVIDKKLKPLPVKPLHDAEPWWHPNNDVLAYLSEDKQSLIFWDVPTMTVQKLTLYFDLRNLVWSPNSEKIVFAANDETLWQVDYPKLDNLKRITPPFYKIHNLQWSPDSTSIAFTSGPDIYIAESIK